MTAISRPQVIALYRNLIRYRDTLTYTDKEYYTRRIRQEFAKHRNLTEDQDIAFYYQRPFVFQLIQTSLAPAAILFQVRGVKKSIKDKLDYSKYPEIREKDLEETFCFGSGPGGQHVNKTESCVQLLHIPTGVRVKCHEQRVRRLNEKIARELLREKVDEFLNGEDSIANQIKRIQKQQLKKQQSRASKHRQLKQQFKQSLQSPAAAPPADESPAGGQ